MDGYLKKLTLKLDMLNLNNGLCCVALFLFAVSCTKKEQNSDKSKESYLEKRAIMSEIAQGSSEEYSKIYQMANDSIKNWTNHKLKSYELYRLSNWYLDSLFCINSSGTKCVMALSYLLSENENHDGMDYFYGVKIKENWFFFRGPNIMLFRQAYGNLSNQPLKIPQLHEIAMKNIFRGYLKKSPTGEWEINERFFSDLTSVAWYVTGWSEPQTQEDWDKIYLYHVNKKWKHKDTTAYSRTQ